VASRKHVSDEDDESNSLRPQTDVRLLLKAPPCAQPRQRYSSPSNDRSSQAEGEIVRKFEDSPQDPGDWSPTQSNAARVGRSPYRQASGSETNLASGLKRVRGHSKSTLEGTFQVDRGARD
jgi:hypothetical protein